MEELIITQRELKAKLVTAINESTLPAFIIKPILEDLLNQVNKIDANQYQQAMQNLKEKKGEKENGI